MKPNTPRRNPSPNHLDTLRAEFDALTQRLQEAEAAASTAQQEADAKSRAYPNWSSDRTRRIGP